ncbi:Hypothetical Protein FCC1311_002562 [Hondaea fermentalgiana]|uniref:Proteasome assembly chaperone 1 n=1 Tax=Hondaea fermentalgiana TaxID=2315210 RepID=A0A2R5G2S9_9STRA|nr:Hypothetical Protein FCC1311_002562 [Hondaea fermentalgiana]|eukprot:GBG24038.1 Hypothetical Protein FCC1311_002562 [Hondaea fermentalgiana]
MAGLVERVTERDAPRSRNTLDEEEEEEARIALQAKPLEVPKLTVHADKTLPQGADVGIVSVGPELSSFVEACFVEGSAEEVGTLEVGPHRAVVRSISSGKVSWVALESIEGIEERALWSWAKATIEALGSPSHVCVVDAMFTYEFLSEGGRHEEPPLVRGLASSAKARASCISLGVDVLESGNLVTGLTAAILGECTFAAPANGCLAFLSLRESQLGAETLLALVGPLLGLLEPISASLDSTFLRDVETVRSACGVIRERRAADRGLLYM